MRETDSEMNACVYASARSVLSASGTKYWARVLEAEAVARKRRCYQCQYPRLLLLHCLDSLAVDPLLRRSLPPNSGAEGANRLEDILGVLKLYPRKVGVPKPVYGGCALDWRIWG